MKKKIYLKWAKSLQKESFNFGDDLNPYIIEKLSGQKVQYVHFANTRLNIVKQFIKEGSKNGFTNDYVSNFFKSMFAKKYVIAIGSILQWYSSSRSIVWGAGIIERNSTVQNSDFRAVRGKYTAKRLIELGYRVPDIYGDPALLLPLVYTPKVSKSYKLGIIPHISHYSLVQQVFSHEDILVIDLNTDNIEAVVDQICSCNYIASTSLHGLIVSHAYGISAVWFEVKMHPLPAIISNFSIISPQLVFLSICLLH